MNSQIFDSYRQPTSCKVNSTCFTSSSYFSYHWLCALVLMAVVILYPERPAWGKEVNLQIGSDPIHACASMVDFENVVAASVDEDG